MPYYGSFIVRVSSFVTSLIKNVELTKVERRGEKLTAYFSCKRVIPMGGIVRMDTDLSLWTSKYTYNVPLTFALVAALLPVISWKRRNFLEIIVILVFVHMMYVVFFEGLQLYYGFIKAGLEKPSIKEQAFWEYFWTFTQSMIIRFEPFLIALYLVMRNLNLGTLSETRKNPLKA